MKQLLYYFCCFLLFMKKPPKWLAKTGEVIALFCMLQLGYMLYSLPSEELVMIPRELLALNPLAYLLVGLIALVITQFLVFKEMFRACVNKQS